MVLTPVTFSVKGPEWVFWAAVVFGVDKVCLWVSEIKRRVVYRSCGGRLTALDCDIVFCIPSGSVSVRKILFVRPPGNNGVAGFFVIPN